MQAAVSERAVAGEVIYSFHAIYSNVQGIGEPGALETSAKEKNIVLLVLHVENGGRAIQNRTQPVWCSENMLED